MAEINVQRKSGSSAIWWILGIVALILIAWFLFAGTGGTEYGSSVQVLRGQLATAAVETAPAA